MTFSKERFDSCVTEAKRCMRDGIETEYDRAIFWANERIKELGQPTAQPAEQQHTNCAVCGVDKPTPLRRDHMGGYVCLTCIDRELNNLFEERFMLKGQIKNLENHISQPTAQPTVCLHAADLAATQRFQEVRHA